MGFTNLFKISRNRDVSDSTPPRDNRSFSASNPPTPSKKSTNPPLIQSLVVLATQISPPPQNKVSLHRGPRLPGSDPREAGPSKGSARNEDRNEGGMFGPRKGRREDDEVGSDNAGGVLQDRSRRRRRTGSLGDLEGGFDRLSFAPPRNQRLDGRSQPSREPLQPSRPSDYSRMHSDQGITRPTSLVVSAEYYPQQRNSYQPPPSPTRPPIVSKYSTSMYPQAFPTPPRPLPPPRSRGPDPFSTPHKSIKDTPILPGAFPNSANNTPTPPPPSHPSVLKNRSISPAPPPLLPKRLSYQPIPASISRATPPTLQTPPRPRPTSSLNTRRYSSQIYGPQYSAPTSSSQMNGVSFRNHHPTSLPIPPSTTTPMKSDSALSSTYRTTLTRPILPASTHSLPTQLPARRLIPLTPSLSTNSLVSISSSPSSSPSRLAIKNQCQGTTASSKRCTRIVNEGSKNNSPSPSPKKVGAGVGIGLGSGSEKKEKKKEREMVVLCRNDLDELDEILGRVGEGEGEGPSVDGKEVARFCFQHSKQAMQERGCFVNGRGGKGEWIEFDHWISADLPTATKILLRYEMTRPVSDKDEEGYIYVHEMVEHKKSQASSLSTSATIFLKLGRSITPVARLAQWRHQCPSRSPIVRDIFPGALSNCEQSGAGIGGALRVRESGGRYHHRWERLVLIEVSGRAGKEAEGRGTEGESAGTGTGRVRSVCVDCGKVHFELFEVGAGAYEIWVKGVVEKWMRWCGEILG